MSDLRAFLDSAGWGDAACEPLTGDASARKYFRLRKQNRRAILMDASRVLDSVAPFIRIGGHLRQLGFSAPEIFFRDEAAGLLLLEDFGDATFAQLLEKPGEEENLFTLATDVLVALHRHPRAVPENLRPYSPEQMLADLELFLEWRTPGISAAAQEEFRAAWRAALPLAHRVPETLLLRDYHVANLMLLPEREGVRRAGLLDFQDAYRGPVTYDLVSLLEDARRDVPGSCGKKCCPATSRNFPRWTRIFLRRRWLCWLRCATRASSPFLNGSPAATVGTNIAGSIRRASNACCNAPCAIPRSMP